MNFARKVCVIRYQNVGSSFNRKFRLSAVNTDSSHASEPVVQEEKFSFEDLKVYERTERRKPQIQPFMKNIFVSVFDKELLAYPEILNKEETEVLNHRLNALTSVFSNKEKSFEDRKTALKRCGMYGAPVSLTKGGLAMNCTESLRYLEVISNDIKLGQEISDHWVGLDALAKGLEAEQYQQIVDDLITGDRTIKLCIKERVAERITQADFRTSAALDNNGVWRLNGEKICDATDYVNNYLLVLSTVETGRLMAFLVHPNAQGISQNGNFVSFLKAPATPLSQISEATLAQSLGTARLHAATMCRVALAKAVRACVDYVKPRVFSGKPLSEVSTIRSCVGDAVVAMYAGESAEYFTAGLADGYADPDTEMEMAMCRNFMANHGLTTILKLLAIPSLEQELECTRLLDDLRHLAARGDSFDSINMFIAINGIHHAGKAMAQEIKQIRNPLMHPTFILRKVLADRHQENDDPKLTLYLSEHLHPTLKPTSEYLEYCVLRMKYASETMMSRHGVNVGKAFTELQRLAEAATEILAMTAALSRASRSYCIGLRNAELEMKLAACFVTATKERVRTLIKEIDDGEFLNLDHFKVEFGRKTLDATEALLENPTARTFW